MTVANSGRVLSVLLVEDSAADARLVRDGLCEANSDARLTVASTGEEALELLDRVKGSDAPDIILLDLNLPGRSGLEVLSHLKHDPDLRRIPVIVLTSSHSARDVNAAYDRGVNLYVHKPMDLDDFFGMVADVERMFGRRAVLPS